MTSEMISKRRSTHAPFPRIICALDGGPGMDAAIAQAIAVADGDSRICFAASSYDTGSAAEAHAPGDDARDLAEHAIAKAREAGAEASAELFDGRRLCDALRAAEAHNDLVVVGAHPHARATGIVLGETATQLVHRAQIPVLVARDRPLEAGIVAATRARPADRVAVTAAAHLAARLGAELTVVHVADADEERRRPELRAELANARALLGRGLDYLTEFGAPARAIVATAEGEGAGLIVVGSDGRRGVRALTSVSERVAHLAPCSVLVMRGRSQ